MSVAAQTDQAAVERILAQVMQANRAVHLMFAAFTKQHGLTIHQVFLLHLLGRAKEPLTLGQLATKLDLAKSTASVEVERMVKAGYLIRQTDPQCRRQVLISLSPNGVDLASAGPAAVTRNIAALLGEVSPADLADIERGLAKLVAVLAEAGPEPTLQEEGT